MSRTFNGTSDTIVANAATYIDNRPWSFSLKYKTTSTATDKYIFANGNSADTDNILALTWENGRVHIFMRSPAGTTLIDHLHAATGLADGAWRHVAFVLNPNGAYSFYSDGTEETGSYTNTAMNLNRLTMGALIRTGAASNFWTGTLAEVATWNSNLTDNDVLSLKNGMRPSRLAPAHYWPLYGVDSPEPDLGGELLEEPVDVDSVHVHTDAADPASIATNTLTSREYLLLHVLAAEGPDTDAYTWDSDYTQITGTGTTGSTDATNVQVRGGYRIATLTSDTVDVTSTTADRDYTQGLVAVALRNAASVGGRGTGTSKASSTVVSATPSTTIPTGAIVVAICALDNNNNATHTGPLGTDLECWDTKGNKWSRLIDAQNANGTGNGIHAGMFICRVRNPITTGDSVVVKQTSAAVTAKAIALHEFSGDVEYGTAVAHVTATVTGTTATAGHPPMLLAA